MRFPGTWTSPKTPGLWHVCVERGAHKYLAKVPKRILGQGDEGKVHVPKSSLSARSLMKNSETKTTALTQECPSNKKKRDGLAGEKTKSVFRMIQMDTNMAQHGKDLENTMEWSQNEKVRLEPEQTIPQQLLGR